MLSLDASNARSYNNGVVITLIFNGSGTLSAAIT